VGKEGSKCLGWDITANTAVEGHAIALVTPTFVAVASVESILIPAVVGATTTATGLSLLVLALVLLLATLAVSCSMTLVVLLWVLKHACRGLVAGFVAEHLDLPLHSIDGCVVVV
jgi:hypothetical protein